MTEKKKALITGVTGQDGYYLAKLLLSKGYKVHGLIRRSSSMCNRNHIDGLDIILHYGDLTDTASIDWIISHNEFDEIYNLGAQSHVGISFKNPNYTFQVNTIGLLNILESCRSIDSNAKIYQASTSEMLAIDYERVYMNQEDYYEEYYYTSATEQTPFEVHSPYAVSKLAAHNLCHIYREAYGMFISCGLLFNHESPIRGENFVTRKIVKGLCRMKAGLQSELYLGNIDVWRDWGFAGDYVEAMWLMLQQDKPDDFVIATGETHSVREFIDECSKQLNIVCKFIQSHMLINETIDGPDGVIYLNKTEKRPFDVDYLCGDASKAKEKLGWEPKVKFKELVRMMVEAELKDEL